MAIEKEIILCNGPSCSKGDTRQIKKSLEEQIARHNLQNKIKIITSGCLGFCKEGPVMLVLPENIYYGNLTPENISVIAENHLLKNSPVENLIIKTNHIYNRFFPTFGDISYFSKQMRIALRNCGVIDPESLDEYLSVRGYEAIATILENMKPQDVVAKIKKSGLRGRGGGGFSTGLKWELTARESSPVKYIICNADEGDPGAFMDRSLIEGDPHTVIEGMIIGGYAIGADKGYVYIRAEYPLAIKRIEKAIADARQAGFLGKNIFGSDFSFDLEIRLGAGAFVCGEETALIHSIEGHRGMPRPRPPYPAAKGLFDKPTVINNVETWGNIPVIILDGEDWFSSIGTEKSKGTKVFALAGKINNTGLVEVPMGTTLREMIFDIGGGIPGGRKFKAVQTGGPSGGCLPADFLDTQIDYDSLAAAGSIMGSGGMIVIDEDSCMVNIAKFFLEFTQDESCGKCTPCREGTKRMLEILTRITEGNGQDGDIQKLERLGNMIKKASLCGLGQSAPNPVLSTIKNFREEYEEHINDKTCRAGVCQHLVAFTIQDNCVGCGACKKVCPVNAITGSPKQKHVIDSELCIRCGLCYRTCKFNAIKKG